MLGGYRGSVLRDLAMNNRRVWIPLKVGLNLRKVDLEVGLDPEDEEAMKERIVPDGMITNVGPVGVSKRLLKRLRSREEENNRSVHDWDMIGGFHRSYYQRDLLSFWRLCRAILKRSLEW